MRFLERPTFLESEGFLERLNFLQHEFQMERVGQRAVHAIGDVCFGSFVVLVLIFTVIAITYKPPDPWLQEQKSYNNRFNSVGNSTFNPDDSVLITGDDLNQSSSGAPSVTFLLPPPINASILNETALEGCNTSNPWTCSDPGVEFAVVNMNERHFPELSFYSYQIVSSSLDGECDVAWQYRPKNITTPRMYLDYRRYSLVRSGDCKFEVTKIGKWHSGVNARPESGLDGAGNEGSSGVFGSVEPVGPEYAFQQTKYLYYTRGADYCKSMNHYMWSFLCAVGEARYLNRTFVMDLDVCLSAENNPGRKDEPGMDFRYYFDYEHLTNMTSIIEKSTFEKELLHWNSLHPGMRSERHVLDHRLKSADLLNDTHTVLYRDFISQDASDNYWFRVCEGEADKYIQRPWDFVWKSKLLMNIVNAICNKLEWDFDVAHIIRGYKAENKKLWPNLDSDTSPENLIAKLKTMIGHRRKLYIATNEPYSHYFDRLREQFEIHMLDDYSHLWAKNSEWYNATMALGRRVDFDGYMKLIVDTEMLYRGKKRVETFNDLTKDCKNGVGSC